MRLLFSYSLRNLLTRRLTTALTASGMALVVFVFSAIVMLAEGLEKTLVDTGDPRNAVVIRRSSGSEVQSGVDRNQAALVEIQPEVASGPDGRPFLAKEMLVLITLEKRGTGRRANVTIRGISEASLLLRPQVEVAAGRFPRAGSTEILVGEAVAGGFRNAGLGESLVFAGRTWPVVGITRAGNTGFSSEIWGDADQMMQAFRRGVFSSVIFRLADPAAFERVKNRIENDPRLTLEVKQETVYYREQSEMMAKFLRILGFSLSVVFSIGAVTGGMITMYAAVANRTAEIGTLRALGFRRGSILSAFLLESVFLGLVGGCAGMIPAAFLQLITVSTTNFQTFSELAFGFTLTPAIALQAIGFAVFMGFAGGILPALSAARMPIIESLRQ